MTDRERSLFEKLVSNRNFYLEFGCGGSTEIAVELGAKQIVSVESDLNWIKKLQNKPRISLAMAQSRLMFEHIDLGPVGEWGSPKDESKIKNWPKYFMTPFMRYDFLYDLILIDGRFRPACAFAAYAFMGEDTILAVHDYLTRPSYYEIEKFFENQEEVDTLVVFKKKRNVVLRSLLTSVLNNLFNY
jgi:hypothetical protein